MFTAYQLHLPNDLRILRYAAPPTYVDDAVIVFDGQIASAPDLFGRSYLFRKRWLEIFLTFNADMRLHADRDSTFPFVFNCDMTTPYVIAGDRAYTIDLWLDILVAEDGKTYQTEDREPFERTCERKLIASEWCDAVERDYQWLIGLIEQGLFLPLLQQIAPFPTAPPPHLLSTCERSTSLPSHFPKIIEGNFFGNSPAI